MWRESSISSGFAPHVISPSWACTVQYVCLISVSPLCSSLSVPAPFYLNDLSLSLYLSFCFSLFATSSPSSRALKQAFGGNRSLMLTRSSFPGVGKYSGHWLGDNAANWNDIKWAIPGMLEFGLFGVPYVSKKGKYYCLVAMTGLNMTARGNHLVSLELQIPFR